MIQYEIRFPDNLPMKFVTFRRNGAAEPGVLDE